MELIELFELMERKENFTCGGVSSPQALSSFESSLGLSLPSAYQKFLQRFSFAFWFGGAVYGISQDKNFDADRHTRVARQEPTSAGFHSPPDHTVVINRYSGGGYYLLHCAPSLRAGTVTLHTDEDMFVEGDAWPTFESYLEWLLK